MSELLDAMMRIKAFAFDIDGVLTSGSVLVTEEGYMLRSVHIKDGYALQHAVKCGYPVAIISGGKSEGMRSRFAGLGITDIWLGQAHKTDAFSAFLQKHGLDPQDVLYMGDDMPDLPLLQLAGIAACPADAATDIRSVCTWIAAAAGGQGCAREVIEKILKLQQTWWNGESHRW